MSISHEINTQLMFDIIFNTKALGLSFYSKGGIAMDLNEKNVNYDKIQDKSRVFDQDHSNKF